MTTLHYGSEVRIQLDAAAMKLVMEAVAAHATRGGWVTTTDVHDREWSFLVTAGIPIWVDHQQ
jgi:hypothetical protein